MGIFDATPLALVTTVLQQINLAMMTIAASIYTIVVLTNHSFRSNNLNLLTVNVCFSTMTYATYWTLFVILTFLPNYFQLASRGNTCTILIYLQIVVNSQVIYSYVIVAVHRFVSIFYFRQKFYKSHQWTCLCFLVQWIAGFLVPIPQIYQSIMVCRGASRTLFINVYTLITLVLCPLIILCASNVAIFILAIRSRSRTVRPNGPPMTTAMTRPPVRTATHGFSQTQTQSFELTDQSANHHKKRSHRLERVSRRDIRILGNIALMLAIFLFGWIPIYFLPTVLPSAFSMGSSLLYIFGSFPSYSLLLNVLLLYRYNRALRQHICLFLTNRIRQFVNSA